MIKLGQTVRDAITGLEGVVIGKHEYLYGCTRISVQPAEHKDGKFADAFTIDEQQALSVDKPNILDIAPKTNERGGDRPVPAMRAVPSR